MLIIAALMAGLAYVGGRVEPLGGPIGIGLLPPQEWIASPLGSLIVSWICTVGMGVLILYVNRQFNVLRSLTSLVALMFFVMQMALPSVVDRFYGGDIMGVLSLVNIVLLFSSYADPGCQRRIFLLFLLQTLAAFTDLSYLLYLPVYILGMLQMRIFNLRTLLAAGLGILCPAWVLFGLGILRPDMLRMPEFRMMWQMFGDPTVIHALVVTGFTIVLGILFTSANLLKILSYNSRVRAFNGFLTLMLGATSLFAVLNFNNFAFYIPILNCLTAYQIAHFFTYRRSRRSYIPILLLVAAYFLFYFL